MIASEDWPTIMHPQIAKLIDRPTTRTLVALEPPDFLYGFISGDTSGSIPIIFYVYVKGPYRSSDAPGGKRSGPRHARGLFAALGVDPARPFIYTCRTAVVTELAIADKIPLARFKPGPARYVNYLAHQEQRNVRRP